MIFCLLPLVLSACSDSLNSSAANDVKVGIQQTRQLAFIQDVPFIVRSPEQARQMMTSKLERDSTEQELTIGSKTGSMTGLFPPGTDLKQQEMKLMGEQVAGFYDPHDKVMVEVHGKSVLGGNLAGRNESAGELLQAHELTHALQDQHFGLERMLDRVKHDDDAEIALHSLMEGDATFAGLGYVNGGLNDETAQTIVEHFAAMPESFEPESGGAPLALSGPMMFQYTAGTRFVAEAWRRGGWAAVDALYRDPPWSTQQIIEPSLYFDDRAPRLKIRLGGYDQVLPGWKKVDEDTFGELLIRIILERNLSAHAPALLLPQAWAGDRMAALRQNEALTLLWMIAFHDDASAREFADAYRGVLDHVGDARNRHLVEVHENCVLVLIGPESNLAQIAPAIWLGSTLTTEEPRTLVSLQDPRSALPDVAALQTRTGPPPHPIGAGR